MSQIYIEWKWVGSFGIDSPYRHMYLVYKPAPDAPIKDWQVIRAGPRNPLGEAGGGTDHANPHPVFASSGPEMCLTSEFRQPC